MTSGQHDDLSIQVAVLSTERRHDREKIERLCARIEKLEAERHYHPSLPSRGASSMWNPDTTALVKLAVAMLLVAAMVALNAAGQHDLAAKVGRLGAMVP